MAYDYPTSVPAELILPLLRATESLVRLDERLARSPVREGWIERAHFADAASSSWLDGELVHIEDLVLHDARMDVRAPTHELIRAHTVLRVRRQIVSNKPDWALSREGLATLCGRIAAGNDDQGISRDFEDDELDDRLETELSAMDAVLERSGAMLERIGQGVARPVAAKRDSLVYDQDWNEEERLSEWRSVRERCSGQPPFLLAASLLDAWNSIEVLQHAPWLGRPLAAALLRQTGSTAAHLACFNVGLRSIPREQRHARDQTARLVAILDALHETAVAGLKEHDRLILVKAQMERRIRGRRANSKLPQLIDLVLSRPIVSAGMIAKELKVTPQGALGLAAELRLREMTGRGRYRAWGIG